jgi:hypothetical protein
LCEHVLAAHDQRRLAELHATGGGLLLGLAQGSCLCVANLVAVVRRHAQQVVGLLLEAPEQALQEELPPRTESEAGNDAAHSE